VSAPETAWGVTPWARTRRVKPPIKANGIAADNKPLIANRTSCDSAPAASPTTVKLVSPNSTIATGRRTLRLAREVATTVSNASHCNAQLTARDQFAAGATITNTSKVSVSKKTAP